VQGFALDAVVPTARQ
jgi:hypothetical protein